MRILLPLLLSAALASSLSASPALARAATRGDLETVKARLAAGDPINAVDSDGWSPLMWAVYYRQIEVSTFLLEKGADPNLQSTRPYKSFPAGTTALILASYYGLEDQAVLLLKHKASKETADASGNTAASYARQFNFPTVLHAMGIEAAVNQHMDDLLKTVGEGKEANAIDAKGWTPLMWSVYYQDLPSTEKLLAKGANPALQSTAACNGLPKGINALMIAAHHGLEDQARAMMAKNPKVDLADSTHATAADYARRARYPAILDVLGLPLNAQMENLLQGIAAGQDINAQDGFGWTPLMWAAFFQDRHSVDVLLAKGADPDRQSQERFQSYPKGSTALMITGQSGHLEIARLLLARGPRLDLADAKGKTAETHAYEYSQYDILDLLVDRRPLPKPYRKIVFKEVTSQVPLTYEYARVGTQCQESFLQTITERKAFEAIASDLTPELKQEGTLVVQAEITQLHIPNGAARFFVGPLAGRTNIDVRVRLIDAATGKLEREQMIRSANSLWLSALTLGARDENFARETGALLADYVLTVCGKGSASR